MGRFISIVHLRLRSLFGRSRVEQELDEELRYHLDREIDEYVAAGMAPHDARLAALRSMGGLEQRREECRDMRGLNLFDNIVNDVRFAFRQLGKDAEFAATAVLMLALGIGSSVAMFAFVDAALVKPLPYRNPERLVGVYEKVEPQCTFCNLSWLDYLDWKRLNSTLDSLDVYQGQGYTLTAASGPQPVRAARVSDGFFRTLGVRPSVGRDFYAGEDKAGAPRTAIISYAAWRGRFSGDAGVLGRKVVLNRVPYEIVGVLPEDFHFAPVGVAEFWVPFQPESECDLRRSCHGLYGVGRLKAGATADAARANFVSIANQLEKEHPDTNRDQGANVRPLAEAVLGDIRPILIVLMAEAGLLLLIAAVDVTGLLLVRSESRRREIAVRSALGASSGRLLEQFVTEAVVLVAAGASLGVLAAHLVREALLRMLSEEILSGVPFFIGLQWNWRVLLFAAAVALMCSVLFSIAPNIRVDTGEIRAGLADGARGAAGTVWRRLGSKLVIVEIATAVVLLVGAGLLVKSLDNLLRVKLGLQPNNLFAIQIAAPDAEYAGAPKAIALAHTILERVSRMPGVRAAALSANGAPLTHNGNTTWIRFLGRPWNGEHLDVPEREITPAYAVTLGAKLVRGRFFDESDDKSKPAVAIVNQAFTRRYFPNEDAVGKQLSHISVKPDPIGIVGIVEDIREGPLDEEIPPVVYRPFNQSPDTDFTLTVRTSQSEASLTQALSGLVRQIDPGIVTLRGATMTERIERSPSAYVHRSTAWLVSGFAALALLLALVGLYGVVAYSVSRRTREIGVRMALGARSGAVCRMVLREAVWLTAIGIVAGLAGAAACSRLIRGLLFDVSPWDPATMASIALGLGIAALIASVVPARRAASVNPVDALRAE